MAKTKSLPREKRKYQKRRQRRANKELFAGLNRKERNELRGSEKGLKGFLKEKGRI